MLGMIKIPFKDLRKEILGVNDQIVTDNMLNQFLNYVPTSEEIASLEPYKDTPDTLQISDRFFLMAASIPQYHARLKSMMFRKNCQARIDEIKPVCLPPPFPSLPWLILILISLY